VWGAEGLNRAARPQRARRRGRRRGPRRQGRRRGIVPAMKEEAGVRPQPAKEGRGARQSEGRGRVEQWREGCGERSRVEEGGA